jgi:hypothetical protein
MRGPRDIERVLDRWFEGDDRVPSRVIDRALENIERIPQRRATRGPRRFTDMPTSLRLLGLAAALAVIGGATYLVAGSMRSTDEPGGPTNLLDAPSTWSASRPAVFGYQAGVYEFDTYDSKVKARAPLPDGRAIALGNVVSSDGSTAVLGPTADCPDEATYRYATSADFLTFTVTPVVDSCDDRRLLLTGDWHHLWTDIGLKIGDEYILDMGGLEARLTVPPWPNVNGDGPYGISEGEPGQPPREMRVGTDVPDRAETDYEFRLVLDPRLARDVCDVQKGYLDADWTFAEFADPRRGGPSATITHPVDTVVAGYPAVQVKVDARASCVVGSFEDSECCPDDMAWFKHGSYWAVDVGDRRVLIQFLRANQPMTPETLDIGVKLVESLRLTPSTP